MKVYELMNQLDDMPAGADIIIRLTKSEDEMCPIDEQDGEKIYSISADLGSAEYELDEVVLSD